jgi:hypothetical protein
MRAMRRSRTLCAALPALALAIAALLVVSARSPAAPTRSQALFKRTLLADARTTSEIKALLRDGRLVVAPEITFADLTGDGRSDAVVLVDSGGVAGAVALYVLSTHGESEESELRAVYRSQRLYRASVEVSGQALVLRTPRYGRGDDICCPERILQRTYTWSERARTLRRRSSEQLPAPT